MKRFQLQRVLAVLLVAAYALPVFRPPPGVLPAPLAPDAPLMERLFPGVPGHWVAIRLLCLLVGTLCALSGIDASLFGGPDGRHAPAKRPPVGRPFVWLALVLAALQLVAGLLASRFGRTEQFAYVACFALAPLVLACGRRPLPTPHLPGWRPVAAVALNAGVWLAVTVPGTWRSLRSADGVDAWIGVQQLQAAADSTFNLVTGRFRTGGGSVYLVLQGAGLLPSLGMHAAFAVAQAAQFLWLGVSGVAVALLMRRLVGTAAACVSAAAFFFSPSTQMMLLTPLALFFGPLMTVGLLSLLVRVHDDDSVSGLVGLGALAGLGATQPALALVAVGIFGAALWRAWQRAAIPKAVVLSALLLFAAGGLTALPSAETFRSMLLSYTRGRAQWVGHEMAGLGQISAAASEYTVETAVPRPLDTPISAVLAPFALPRTPLRLLGDVLFDPLGAALAAIGIGVCLRAARRSWFARVLLGVLAAAVVPGCVASADRISILRLMITPVPMALLAGVGWESARRSFGPAWRSNVATGLVAAVIAGGGMLVFNYVNPQILASSWVGLTVQALEGGAPVGTAVLLDHPDPHTFPYWYLNEILQSLPQRSITVREYDGVSRLLGQRGDEPAGGDIVFWSPALEEDRHVSHAICQEWPGAKLYTLVDPAGLSRAFAARPHGEKWRPGLPASQWRVEACGSALPTEATWAADILRQARTLTAQGRPLDARAVLRAAARKNFCQTDLFEAAAESILTSSPSARESQDAVYWAQRASQVTRFRDAVALSTLAAAYAAARQFSDAVDAGRQARQLAVAQANDALVAEIDRHLREYEEAARAE